MFTKCEKKVFNESCSDHIHVEMHAFGMNVYLHRSRLTSEEL